MVKFQKEYIGHEELKASEEYDIMQEYRIKYERWKAKVKLVTTEISNKNPRNNIVTVVSPGTEQYDDQHSELSLQSELDLNT